MGFSYAMPSSLATYSQRQQEFDTTRDKRRGDIALNNALAEQKARDEAALQRQQEMGKTVLKQEEMQQEGANFRANPAMEHQRLANDVYKAFGMKGAAADVTEKTIANSSNQLSLDFKKAVQPGLVDETKAKAKASIAQSNRFGTYYSGEQAKDERTAVMGRFNVSPEGIISNKKEYLDPEYGAGNLMSDMKAAAEEDRTGSAPRNNEKIAPDLKPALSPRLSKGMLSRKSRLATP